MNCVILPLLEMFKVGKVWEVYSPLIYEYKYIATLHEMVFLPLKKTYLRFFVLASGEKVSTSHYVSVCRFVPSLVQREIWVGKPQRQRVSREKRRMLVEKSTSDPWPTHPTMTLLT